MKFRVNYGSGIELFYNMKITVAQTEKDQPAKQKTWVWSLGWEDPLGKEMATQCSILVWRIPRTEERGELQSMGVTKSQTQWSDQNTHTHTHTHTHAHTVSLKDFLDSSFLLPFPTPISLFFPSLKVKASSRVWLSFPLPNWKTVAYI